MTRADNSAFLVQANTRRHQAALAAARHAIDQLRREGKAISYVAVAHAAGVSRTWLYRQDQIRELISQLRDHQPPAAAQHASTDSLCQRLDTARAEITRLRAENRSLRDQLARQLGLQRTQHAKTRPPDREDTGHDPRSRRSDMSTPQKCPSNRHDSPAASGSAVRCGFVDATRADDRRTDADVLFASGQSPIGLNLWLGRLHRCHAVRLGGRASMKASTG
jgi:Family of unknown function (DUF6262)